MAEFDPNDYGPVVASCWDAGRLPELGPGSPNSKARRPLNALSVKSAFDGRPIVDRHMATACLAAIWLWNDYLEESHKISQDIHTPTGSYWHGIMHRREPDYSNAKYWYGKVGDHPTFGPLCGESRRLLAETPGDETTAFLAEQTAWAPYRFVDLCAEVYESGAAAETVCRKIARRECELLFDFCYRAATGT